MTSSPRDPSIAVAVRGVSKRFGRVEAVRSVSFEVGSGQYVTLLGPSGSGKTTLLRLIAGLELPDGGEIEIGERPATTLPPHRRRVGVVFQGYALFPHLNVLDNIAYPLRMQGLGGQRRRARAAAILARLGLGGLERRRTYELSGGQQQRVALARALVHDPPVLLLDEPLSALDRELRERMRLELRRIQRDFGVAVLHVTHDQEEALSLSDTVIVMDSGRVVQVGAPEDLYDCPSSPFAARFLGGVALPAKVCSHGGAADRGCAQVASGHLRVRRPLAAATATVGHVAIRREWLALSEDPGGEGLEGVVQAIGYLGGQYEVNLRLKDGTDIPVRIAREPGRLKFREGDTARLVQTREAWFMPEDQSGE